MTRRDHWHEDARAAMAVLLADALARNSGEYPVTWQKMSEEAAHIADCLNAEGLKRSPFFLTGKTKEEKP